MQLPPSLLLSKIIKHYLFIESEGGTHPNYRLFSDGNPGIVFHLKSPLLQYDKDYLTGQLQPQSFIYGQITNYNNIALSGKLSMLVVVLQPYGIYLLLGIDAHEVNNSTLKLADILGAKAKHLEEQVLSSPNTSAAIAVIESFLLNKQMAINKFDGLMEETLKLIDHRNGQITIEQLLKTIPISERQLERRFNSYIGISPKRFTDVVKLQYFLKSLQKWPDKKITDVVYSCGYYDQAHLNNFFKKSTGITPAVYKANQSLLAINFMPV